MGHMHGYYKFEPHSYGLVPRGQGGASEPARKRAAVSPLGNEGILPTMSTTRLKDPSSYSMEAGDLKRVNGVRPPLLPPQQMSVCSQCSSSACCVSSGGAVLWFAFGLLHCLW